MKQILLAIFLFTGMMLSAQDNGEWESWQKTSCYSKVSYRIKSEKMNGERYHWKIQFKNDYAQLISFNYRVTDELETYNVTTHRKTINARQVSEELDVYSKKDDIYLLVDKLSLSPYPGNFVECDN
jgi:hypothetical protein